MFLMIKKGMNNGICHAVFRQEKANNNHVKNFDKYNDPKYIRALLKNNLYVKAISEKLPINWFHWNKIFEFTKKGIKNYKYCKIGAFFKTDVEYSEQLGSLHNDLLFLSPK